MRLNGPDPGRLDPLRPDPRQVVQRVRVGLIGLAAVILLIGLAGMIFSAVRRGQGAAVPGTGNAAMIANATDAGDPLADLGVAPGSAATQNSR